MVVLFYLILLFFERNTLDIIIYVFSNPRIMLGLNVFSSFYIFSIDFIIDSIHFYVIPVIGLILIF